MSVLRKGRHGRSTRQGPRRRNLVPETRHSDGAGLSGQCAPAARAGSAAGLPHEEVRGREEPRWLREALGEQPRDEERQLRPICRHQSHCARGALSARCWPERL